MLRRIALLLVLSLLMLAGGIWLGGHPDRLPEQVRGALVDDTVASVGEGLGIIERRYYRKPNGDELEQAALKGAVESLEDPFSAYLSPKDLVAFQERTDARFEGIGVAIEKVDRGLRILRVYDDSPAKRAGLEVGDVIVRAGGDDLAGLSAEAASALIRGPAGTDIRLGVRRDGKTLQRDVERAQVRIPLVASEYDREAKTGIVRLASFSSGAHGELQVAIKRLQRRGAERIVLDLRGNPGGLVSEARLVASLFLDGGPIVTTKGRAARERTLEAGDDPAFPKIPLAVLVDENSASASEIVAGALQDRDRAAVVGTRTFGKGVFQEVIPLDSGGALDITVGQYFTPKGRNLGGAAGPRETPTPAPAGSTPTPTPRAGSGGDQDEGQSREAVERGRGIAPDVRAVDDPDTPQDEAVEKAVDVVGR